MPDNILTRIKNAWNVFAGNEKEIPANGSGGYSHRPDMLRFSYDTTSSVVSPLYTRIGIDAASIRYVHAKVDRNGNFSKIIPTGLNNCLTIEANIDQSARAFIQDVAMSLCDEGAIAIVPVDVTLNPYNSSSYDIHTMRTGKITEWYPHHVRVRLYDDRDGIFKDLILPKTNVAIAVNPLYAVMNEPSSTLKRLIEKLNILDAIDRQSGQGKLDLIIQLPYVVRSELQEQQAERRRQSIIEQLRDTQYGIAYTSATEKVTQLNRPAENNLMTQIEYLTKMLYSQLGLTEGVFDGTASPGEMLNYYNRTIEPLSAAIADAMCRVFLTKTARTQGQVVMTIRSAFRYVSPDQVPDFTDKMTRNEVMSSNEVRAILGMHPSDDPKADELRNKNLNPSSIEESGDE